jgi:hypothetical protein
MDLLTRLDRGRLLILWQWAPLVQHNTNRGHAGARESTFAMCTVPPTNPSRWTDPVGAEARGSLTTPPHQYRRRHDHHLDAAPQWLPCLHRLKVTPSNP